MGRGLFIGVGIGAVAAMLVIWFAQDVVVPLARHSAQPKGPVATVEMWLTASRRADVEALENLSAPDLRRQIERDRAIIIRTVAVDPLKELAEIEAANLAAAAENGAASSATPGEVVVAVPAFDFEFMLFPDRTQMWDDTPPKAAVFSTLTRRGQTIGRRFELVRLDGEWKVQSWSNESADVTAE